MIPDYQAWMDRLSLMSKSAIAELSPADAKSLHQSMLVMAEMYSATAEIVTELELENNKFRAAAEEKPAEKPKKKGK